MQIQQLPFLLKRRSVLGMIAVAGAVGLTSPVLGSTLKSDAPEILFVSNPLADYLHWLFFREPGPGAKPFEALSADLPPPFTSLVSVPEAVASAGIDSYDRLEMFVSGAFSELPARMAAGNRTLYFSNSAPSLETILQTLRAGASTYHAFEEYWRAAVAPFVETQIAGWRTQVASFDPMRQLQTLHRLPFEWPSLQVVAMPFHPAGSSNFSPPAVYSSLFRRPDIGRVLGHEASHLIWSDALTNGRQRRHSPELKRLVDDRKVDLEEVTCLLMQTELSRLCGVTLQDYRLSTQFPDTSRQKPLLALLEQEWSLFTTSPDRWPTSIDYALDKAKQLWG